MRVVKSVAVEDILARGSIKDADVARLIEGFSSSPTVTEDDADTLFYLNRACPVQAPAWCTFFVDLLADFHIHQMAPCGYVTADKSQWLTHLIVTDGRVATRNEFDLLVAVIRRSRWFPLSLLRFGLEQVREAIVHGSGPLRAGLGGVGPGQVLVSDVDLIRDMLCAFGGGSSLPLTRHELEILLDIEMRVGCHEPPAAWTDLFAKAICNAVLCGGGYVGPERGLALRGSHTLREDLTLADRVTVSLAPVVQDYCWPSAEEQALSRLERQRIEIVTNEEILDQQDTVWIDHRIQGRVACTPAEREVFRFLREENLLLDAAFGEVERRWKGRI